MNKRQIIITSLSDLEKEERKVRQRIKRQEAELLLRVKKLPEELVSAAIERTISGILGGNTFKSALNFIKKIGKNVLSNLFKEAAE